MHLNRKSPDPYDIWAIPALGQLKISFYSGAFNAKLLIAAIYLADLIFPTALRRLLNVDTHTFPHTEAMLVLAEDDPDKLRDIAPEVVEYFSDSATSINGKGWGLPFEWYSKNGVYPASTPYITNSPYVMEALLKLSSYAESLPLFFETWDFIESLEEMYCTESKLALSYSPIIEPRIVNNANSYAAFSYALHAVYGEESNKSVADTKARRIVTWLIEQQASDGSWTYYADRAPGNFIDCFHSCFIVKNLLKIGRLMPDTLEITQPAVTVGWTYIQTQLYDKEKRLCRRFSNRDIKDPFRWDIYDQAEYLGLLVDFDEIERAGDLVEAIRHTFYKGGSWYCRVDIFGRKWGRDFMRWGIVPYMHQAARYSKIAGRAL